MGNAVVEGWVLDLLEWLTKRDRSNEETLGAWRTFCPNLPVWEDANDRGLVMMEATVDRKIVRLTSPGFARAASALEGLLYLLTPKIGNLNATPIPARILIQIPTTRTSRTRSSTWWPSVIG